MKDIIILSDGEKKLLKETAIRELSTRCRYALISYLKIEVNIQEENQEGVFSSIHLFLINCANISKILWSKEIKKHLGSKIANILEIPNSFNIKKREFRNDLEHYDDRLVKWIKERGEKVNTIDYCIGPKSAIKFGENTQYIYIRHYDGDKKIFIFCDKELYLVDLYKEIFEIGKKAETWSRGIL